MEIDLKKARQAVKKAQAALDALEQMEASARRVRTARGAAHAPKRMSKPARTKKDRAIANFAASTRSLAGLTGIAARQDSFSTAQSPLSSFFATMGQSLVDAQKAMDERSRDYLLSIANKPYLLPSIFRIPKLSASVKFAVDAVNDKGVNLLFYKDETTTTTQNQQSVEFDIVSAPLSPGTIAGPFSISPLLDPSARGAVFDRLQQVLPGTSPLRSDQDRVLLLANDSASTFYVIYAEKGNLGLWHADIGNPAQITELRPFGAAGDAEALRSIVAGQGDAQKALLERLG